MAEWTPERPAVKGAFQPDDMPGLMGIPSRHYDPAFARIAIQAIESFQPCLVTLELPFDPVGDLEREMDWAASCWPAPMVSATASSLFPFVPGDSIFEAFRYARAKEIPVALIDLACDRPGKPRDQTPSMQAAISPALPDMAWFDHEPALYLRTLDAILDQSPPDNRDMAREAWMASILHQLLGVHERVLWVGGMAHWTRIVNRLRTGDFAGPEMDQSPLAVTRRMRLTPGALLRMTGRLPWLVKRYADDQRGYDETAAIQTLAQKAAGKSADLDFVLVGTNPDAVENIRTDPARHEPVAPVDVAKTLLYARNLAATSGPRERPDLSELLTSAAMMVNPWYAGRLYVLAMEDHAQKAAQKAALEHDALEFEYRDGREIYHCKGEIIDARPWQPEQGGNVLTIAEVRRRVREAPDDGLPASKEGDKKDDFYWISDPGVEEAYSSFLDYLLRRANPADTEESRTAPFQTGLADGIDVRATVRNWTSGDIHVREDRRGKLRVTNAAIDWTGMSEQSDVLQGRISNAGWVDPNLTRAGSCSRMNEDAVTDISLNPYIRLFQREFSLITLDCPTYIHHTTDKNAKTFFDVVIEPLVKIQASDQDTLYTWLHLMFLYCSGKPFAYYSRYIPGPKIHRIAWEHGVRIIHIPLRRIPEAMLSRHMKFRYYKVNREQWLEFTRRQAEGAGMWGW